MATRKKTPVPSAKSPAKKSAPPALSSGEKPKTIELGRIERALIQGDLSGLTEEERAVHYLRVCQTLGLNHLTVPFEYLKTKDGKLVLYAKKSCTEQLRSIHGVSVESCDITNGKVPGGTVVVAKVVLRDKGGRSDVAAGAVFYGDRADGDHVANAVMKAETKAKRRGTLSICGLGMNDESEVDDIPDVVLLGASPMERIVESAVKELPAHSPPHPDDRNPLPEEGITKSQLTLIQVMLKELGYTADQVNAVKKQYGVESSKDLTKVQASQLIDELKAKQNNCSAANKE